MEMILIRTDRSTDEKVDLTEQFGECVGDNCILEIVCFSKK